VVKREAQSRWEKKKVVITTSLHKVMYDGPFLSSPRSFESSDDGKSVGVGKSNNTQKQKE
jgi:hypothetical protein